ncbi:MAG: COX15/CtaA family protein, partial [Sediminibacterium sp.]
QPFLLNFIDNKILIHFIHRGLAYLILIVIVIWTIQLAKQKAGIVFENIKRIPLYLTCLQVLLGILTILTSTGIVPGKWGTFEWMAQIHQLTGMCLLLSLVATLFVLRKSPANN